MASRGGYQNIPSAAPLRERTDPILPAGTGHFPSRHPLHPLHSPRSNCISSPLGSTGTEKERTERLKTLQNGRLNCHKSFMPVARSRSVRTVALNTFDSWQSSKCKANESPPTQKSQLKKFIITNSESVNL
jgi:hypothetical protein